MNLLSALFTNLNGSRSGGAESYVEVTGETPSIIAEAEKAYLCSAIVTALTISSIPEKGIFSIIFKAGSTPPQITGPACIVYWENNGVETDKMNEISYHCFKIGNDQYCQGLIASFDDPS